MALLIQYLFCGSTGDANVELRLRSQLNDFYAYPTTIFVDKNGVVKKIHVGFNGPGTGERIPTTGSAIL